MGANQGETKPEISFFFPAFNDAGTVEALAEQALAVLARVASRYEVIIVNDGSVDDTGAAADRVAAAHPDTVKVVHHLYNIGYGAALKTGFKTARYEWVFYTDGDLQYHPEELEQLLAARGDADIVSGYRDRSIDHWSRRFSSWWFNRVSRFFFRLETRDIDAAFKLIRKSAVDRMNLSINGSFICAELFLKARKLGLKVVQLPIRYRARTYGSSSAFQLFFILRALLELMELWWLELGKEAYYRRRQAALRGKR